MLKVLPFLILFLTLSGGADDAIFRSDLTLEVRQFQDDGVSETFENQRSIKLHLELEKDLDNFESKASINTRFDDQDPTRNVFWSEDTYFKHQVSQNVSVSAGFQVFSFSYMEAFHPLDEMNARIIDISVVNSEKMGEPFIGFQSYLLDGDFKFFLLPYPLRPVLPGKDSRLNLPNDFEKGEWIGQEGREADVSDHFFVSFEKTFDSMDVLFLASKGMDRSRLLVGTIDYTVFGESAFPNTANVFTPYYFERYLSGVNGVYNFESFQLKGSIAHSYYLSDDEILVARSETEFYTVTPADYTALAVGFEKPVSHTNGFDSTFLIEYQTIFTDSEDRDSFPLQNDLFLAWRLSLNDINSKQVVLSSMFDLESSELSGFAQISYSQRFFESWKVEFALLDYFIPDDAPLSGLGFFRDKENASLKIQKYF